MVLTSNIQQSIKSFKLLILLRIVKALLSISFGTKYWPTFQIGIQSKESNEYSQCLIKRAKDSLIEMTTGE